MLIISRSVKFVSSPTGADSLASCPVEGVLNGSVSITCTAGGAVKCSCDRGMEVGVATNSSSMRCQSEFHSISLDASVQTCEN